MKTLHSSRRALTLVEMMISTMVMSMVMAGVLAAVVSLQRSFVAAQQFVTAHLEQVRTLDSLKRDARQATAMDVRPGGAGVVLTMPAAAPGLLDLQLPSTVLGLLLPAGSPVPAPVTTTVTYAFAGQRITRTEGAVVQTVATRQSRFQMQKSGSQLLATIAFLSEENRRMVECPATTASAMIYSRADSW